MRLTLTIAGHHLLDLVIARTPPAPDPQADDDAGDDQDPIPFGYAIASDHELSYQDPECHHAE